MLRKYPKEKILNYVKNSDDLRCDAKIIFEEAVEEQLKKGIAIKK